jgi:DNA-binding transcriptional regulator LsrR (DeoR family)
MYHEQGMRQPQIAADLHMSQSRVSRLLQQAGEVGIVRTTVTLPNGVYTEVEEELAARYQLLDAVIIDHMSSGGPVRALGAAAAAYLRETLATGDVVGVSSRSDALLATVEALRPRTGLVVKAVTQLVDGAEDPRVIADNIRLIHRLANVTGARAVFLPQHGLAKNQAPPRAMRGESAVSHVQQTWRELSVVLVGVGCAVPSHLPSGNESAVDVEEHAELAYLGAVGEICLRFFDHEGRPIASPLDTRVLGISAELLRAVPRRIGVAGGLEKRRAIAAAMEGRWINTLITDLQTARQLLQAHTDQGLDAG